MAEYFAAEQEMLRLMDAYGPSLVGMCTLLLKDAHLAQDVVQETFIRAWRQGKLRQETEKAWLTRVAVNLCRDEYRSRWFRHVDRRITPEELPIPADAPEEEGGLLDRVSLLPLKEREVIVMHYWGGMTAAEVAETLGIARASVYRRMDNARKKLKIELDEKGDAAHD